MQKCIKFYTCIIVLSFITSCGILPESIPTKPGKVALSWPIKWGKTQDYYNKMIKTQGNYYLLYIKKGDNAILNFGPGWEKIHIQTTTDKVDLKYLFKPSWKFEAPQQWVNNAFRNFNSNVPYYQIKEMYYSYGAYQIADEKTAIHSPTQTLGECGYSEEWRKPNVISFKLKQVSLKNSAYIEEPIVVVRIKDLPNNVPIEKIYKDNLLR